MVAEVVVAEKIDVGAERARRESFANQTLVPKCVRKREQATHCSLLVAASFAASPVSQLRMLHNKMRHTPLAYLSYFTVSRISVLL